MILKMLIHQIERDAIMDKVNIVFNMAELEILEEILEEALKQDIMAEDTQSLLDKVQGYLVKYN